MSSKILIAMDTSENALKAVKYAAGKLGRDSKVTLYHVFFKTPHMDYENIESLPHHHLSFTGATEDFKKWLMSQKLAVADSMDAAKKILVEGGLDQKISRPGLRKKKKGSRRIFSTKSRKADMTL